MTIFSPSTAKKTRRRTFPSRARDEGSSIPKSLQRTDKDFAKDCEQQVEILKTKQGELAEHIAKLKDAIKQENDPAVLGKRKQIQDAIRQAEFAAQQANYEEALKKYKEAILDFNKMLLTEKDNADAYFFRGIAKLNTKDKKGALNDFTEAIQLKSDHSEEAKVYRDKLKTKK